MNFRNFSPVSLGLVVALVAAAPGFAQEYKNYANVVADIQAIASGSGGSTTASELKDGGGAVINTQGANPKTIWMLKIAKGGGGASKVLVTATQHAREWVAYRAALTTASFVVANRASDTWAADARFDHFKKFKEMNIKALTDNATIFIVPVVNSEGYFYSKEVANDAAKPGDEGWRKNRRDVSGDAVAAGEPAGAPLVGVDLNRNYPSSDWGNVTLAGAFETTSRWRWEDVYCGKPKGNSWTGAGGFRPPIVEKETEAIVTLSGANAFACHIDIHSFGGTVGWTESADSANENLRPGSGFKDDKTFQILGGKAASLIIDPSGGAYTPQASPYKTSGDILVWQYENRAKKCFTYLIELAKGSSFRPANATAQSDAALPGQLFMMFATVDKSFANKPDAKFRKPPP